MLRKVAAKVVNATLKRLAPRLVHPRTLALVHRSVRFASTHVAMVLFSINAAFASTGWEWMWVVFTRMGILGGGHVCASCLVRRLHSSGHVCGRRRSSTFGIERGIKQGCPSSGSFWALLFGLVVQVLRMHRAGPRDDLSVFADDIAATIAQVIAHLALLRVFDALRVAAVLATNCAQIVVINYGPLSGFALERRLFGAIGVAQMVVARSAVYLGLRCRQVQPFALCREPRRLSSGSDLLNPGPMWRVSSSTLRNSRRPLRVQSASRPPRPRPRHPP